MTPERFQFLSDPTPVTQVVLGYKPPGQDTGLSFNLKRDHLIIHNLDVFKMKEVSCGCNFERRSIREGRASRLYWLGFQTRLWETEA